MLLPTTVTRMPPEGIPLGTLTWLTIPDSAYSMVGSSTYWNICLVKRRTPRSNVICNSPLRNLLEAVVRQMAWLALVKVMVQGSDGSMTAWMELPAFMNFP